MCHDTFRDALLAGTSLHEVGAAGTVYTELRHRANNSAISRYLLVNNNHHDYPHMPTYSHGNLYNLFDGLYDDISRVGGVTWLFHDEPSYHFDEVEIKGKAHVALLSNTSNEEVNVHVTKLTGDRSGVVHIAQRQTFEFEELNVYLPCNVMNYK